MHGILYSVVLIGIFECRANEQSILSHAFPGHRVLDGFHIKRFLDLAVQGDCHLLCRFYVNDLPTECFFDGLCAAIAPCCQLRAGFLFHIQPLLIDNCMGSIPRTAQFDLLQNPVAVFLFDCANRFLCKFRELLNFPQIVFFSPCSIRLVAVTVVIALQTGGWGKSCLFGFYVLLRNDCKGFSCIAGFLVCLLLLLPFKFGGGSIGSGIARTSVFQLSGVKIKPTITAFDFAVHQNICSDLVIPGLLLGFDQFNGCHIFTVLSVWWLSLSR